MIVNLVQNAAILPQYSLLTKMPPDNQLQARNITAGYPLIHIGSQKISHCEPRVNKRETEPPCESMTKISNFNNRQRPSQHW